MVENTDLSSTDKLKAQKKEQTKQTLKESAKAESSQVATIVPETPKEEVSPLPIVIPKKSGSRKSASPIPTPSRTSLKHAEEAQMLRTHCKQLGLSLSLQAHGPTHSLGFTSAIQSEGKSFLAKLTAEVMAEDTSIHVVLLECNWENPTFGSTFGLAAGSGLAEWLQGKSSLKAIRNRITSNLTVIPAGEGKQDAIYLLRELQQRGIHDVLTTPDELLIVDLPATITTSYGQYAAQLVDALILVVRMGVTPEALVIEAHNQIKNLPVQGIVLNQVASRIPRWLRQIL